MEVKFSIRYHPAVLSEDIPKLGATEEKRIKEAIEQKLTTRPEDFGVPLRRSIKGFRKLRVGSFRIVFKISDPVIYILTIQHRSVVYQTAKKRY